MLRDAFEYRVEKRWRKFSTALCEPRLLCYDFIDLLPIALKKASIPQLFSIIGEKRDSARPCMQISQIVRRSYEGN